MKSISTIFCLLSLSLSTLFASDVTIGQRFSKVKSSWPETIGNEKELTILNYTFMDEPVLATLYFTQKKVSGFVFIGKKVKSGKEITHVVNTAIKTLAAENGMPDKVLSADISDSLLQPLQHKENLEIAQWSKSSRLYKLGIVKNKDSYVLTYSGAKIE